MALGDKRRPTPEELDQAIDIAYQRGWDAALAAVAEATNKLRREAPKEKENA